MPRRNLVCVSSKWLIYICVFFCKQKTAYEIVSRDWSSDVCSSDLVEGIGSSRLLPLRPQIVIIIFTLGQPRHNFYRMPCFLDVARHI